MTIIAHASDLHGDLGPLMALGVRPDVWVLSGDICPNESRGFADIEVPYQTEWAHDFRAELAEIFEGRPVVSVPGNHDYIDMGAVLRDLGLIAHTVSETNPVTMAGLRFAGFRHVPWMYGEWAGETHEFGAVIDQVFSQNPDILVTHAPAAGILDDGMAIKSIRELATALAYRPHGIQAHLFGHVHTVGGQQVNEMGIQFSNAAETCQIIEV